MLGDRQLMHILTGCVDRVLGRRYGGAISVDAATYQCVARLPPMGAELMTTHMPDLFDNDFIAVSYRRYLEPVVFDPWALRLVHAAAVSEGDTVLDVAAGTGSVARAAARLVGPLGQVYANDISASMLAQLTRKADEGSARITAFLGSAESLDMPDASADIVLCQQGLQFMPHVDTVLAECARVLRPGGVFAASVWSDSQRIEPIDSYADAVERPDLIGKWNPTIMREHLTAAGLREVSVAEESLDVRWQSLEDEVSGILGSPFAPFLKELDDADRDVTLRRLREHLGGPGGRTLAHRMFSIVGRAVR